MPYLFGDIIPDELVAARCCACGATPGRDALSPVHLRLTARFPFIWLQRGPAPRAWWRSCVAALRANPTDADASAHYLCSVCLHLTRGAPQAAPGAPSDEPASVPPTRASMPTVSSTRRVEGGDDLARHILDLRQVFGRSAMIDGVIREGHCGIQLTRGSGAVRCRACGQDIAHVADLAGATAEDESMYEYTPAGLRACPATSTVSRANDGERDDAEPSHRTPLVCHARGSWQAPRPAS